MVFSLLGDNYLRYITWKVVGKREQPLGLCFACKIIFLKVHSKLLPSNSQPLKLAFRPYTYHIPLDGAVHHVTSPCTFLLSTHAHCKLSYLPINTECFLNFVLGAFLHLNYGMKLKIHSRDFQSIALCQVQVHVVSTSPLFFPFALRKQHCFSGVVSQPSFPLCFQPPETNHHSSGTAEILQTPPVGRILAPVYVGLVLFHTAGVPACCHAQGRPRLFMKLSRLSGHVCATFPLSILLSGHF